jgi:two-component system response regulator BaeR
MILIVEDEPSLAQVLAEYLTHAEFDTHIISNGLDVLPWVASNHPDLILLDLNLPGMDGISLFKELRELSAVPVMMTTARVAEIDRLLGLELGVDDYICKPYSPREVVARAKNLLRRLEHVLSGNNVDFGGLIIDPERMTIHVEGQLLEFTPAEFRLLEFLYKNHGKVFSRDQLMMQIYDDRRVVTDRTIDSHIKNLRRKLHTVAPATEYIRSVYGVGYKLEVESVT